jgi:hypothetical protein
MFLSVPVKEPKFIVHALQHIIIKVIYNIIIEVQYIEK